MRIAIVARELDDTPVSREIPPQHRDATVVAERRMGGTEDLLSRGLLRRSCDFGDRPAIHRTGVAVEQAELEEPLHEDGETSRCEDVRRHEATSGTDIREDRCPCADGVEVVDLEGDTGFRRDREEMQYGIGRAT